MEKFGIDFVYETSICDYYKIRKIAGSVNYTALDLTIPLPCYQGKLSKNRCFVLWVKSAKAGHKVDPQFVFHANDRATSVRTSNPVRIIEELGKLLPTLAYEQKQLTVSWQPKRYLVIYTR